MNFFSFLQTNSQNNPFIYLKKKYYYLYVWIASWLCLHRRCIYIRILYVTTKFMKSAKIKGIVCIHKNIRYINKWKNSQTFFFIFKSVNIGNLHLKCSKLLEAICRIITALVFDGLWNGGGTCVCFVYCWAIKSNEWT